MEFKIEIIFEDNSRFETEDCGENMFNIIKKYVTKSDKPKSIIIQTIKE